MAGGLQIDQVTDLIAAADEPDNWIVQGLIEAGDQIVLSGAPKAGKSLFASQLALAVASGHPFLRWSVLESRRVLYVNLELRPKRFGKRLIAQVGAASALSSCENLFTINDLRTLDIKNTNESSVFAEKVEELRVELVIWDVLARMHSAEENDNGAMRAVMHAIRLASADRAHVILHHARKPSGNQAAINLGAASMRGASSIHGEADLVMSLHVRAGQGPRYSVMFSARNIEEPDEILLDRDAPTLLFHEPRERAPDRFLTAVADLFLDGDCEPKTLTERVMTSYGVKDRRAKQCIKEAVEQHVIVRVPLPGGRYIYRLPDSHPTSNNKPLLH